MNTTLCDNWTGFAASIPGSGHIRRGLPCQDASAVIATPRPALIVCDGRGSAKASQDGARGAVRAFQTQLAVFEPMLSSVLDDERASEDRWQQFSRIMYRTLMQVKLDLARERGIPEKEFDFTVAFAVVGTCHIGCFQVGDGAIVLRQDGETLTAFAPDKGEFANQTCFLREDGEALGKYHAALFAANANTGIAITSDGPEHLMFKLPSMTPGRIFDMMLDDLHAQCLCQQDLMDYLTRRDWENDPRGSDDRSIAILAPRNYPVRVSQPDNEADVAPVGTNKPEQAQATEMPPPQNSPAEPAPGPQAESDIVEKSPVQPVDAAVTSPNGQLDDTHQEQPAETSSSQLESNATPSEQEAAVDSGRDEPAAAPPETSGNSASRPLECATKIAAPLLVICLVFATTTFAWHEKAKLNAALRENAVLQQENYNLEEEILQRNRFISALLSAGRLSLGLSASQAAEAAWENRQGRPELIP